MTRISILFVLCLCNLMIATVDAQSLSGRITVGEAQKLVEEAIYPNKTKAELDKMDNRYEPDFVLFEAIDPNPKHSAQLGTYAVNIWTGDVWTTAGSCTRIISARLTKLQKTIRARTTLPPMKFEELRAKKPICDLD